VAARVARRRVDPGRVDPVEREYDFGVEKSARPSAASAGR
jgi:hypothetical protein